MPGLGHSFLQFAELGAHAVIQRLEFVGRPIHLLGLFCPQSVFHRRIFVASQPLRIEHWILFQKLVDEFLLILREVGDDDDDDDDDEQVWPDSGQHKSFDNL